MHSWLRGSMGFEKYKKWAKLGPCFSFNKPTKQEIFLFTRDLVVPSSTLTLFWSSEPEPCPNPCCCCCCPIHYHCTCPCICPCPCPFPFFSPCLFLYFYLSLSLTLSKPLCCHCSLPNAHHLQLSLSALLDSPNGIFKKYADLLVGL